ncbi:type II toxin-antitoxin system VapC family toxin [Bosea sp. PAMC 26642]|uniref:type II toxin-antitoxin system VapC family toxin n=1 Tax=Bosea sp. (strain PAMC 26642) TaxID=1792307 RepID=UPI0007705A03|nr:PIN domain-containing protein [Bosea sp. PAMC 26642]AMJ62064.1 DNA-binding protein [Bosea sp. PAMC 26642]
MIVVDSSVWIAQLRSQDTRAAAKLAEMDTPDYIVVGDLVLMEVLRGARDERHADRLERSLRRFKVQRMVDETIAVSAARHARLLRSRGVTIRKTIDLLIATFCIERNYELLHQDRDFDMIARHTALRIA